MKKDSKAKLLRGVWLFERCSRAEVALLASTTSEFRVPAGKVLAREGDLGRKFFVIASGSVEASRNGVRLGTLGAGTFFGEMALLDRQVRAATITATEPCDVLVLTTREFLRVVETMPSVDRKIITVLAGRLRDIEDRFLPAERYLPTDERRLAKATS